MSQKIVVGSITKGLTNNVEPWNVDNEAFPTLVNAYEWRGRIKRKRGTSLLGRLQRQITYTSGSPLMTLDGSGNGSATIAIPSSEAFATIPNGSVNLTDGTNSYTDAMGIITGAPAGSGTINYLTGAITITGGAAGQKVTGTVGYSPALPVMGLEDLYLGNAQYPGMLAFDTKYSYNIATTSPYAITDVTFYKNTTTPVTKATPTPFVWHNQDYQQFWTVNYQSSLFATNGVVVNAVTTPQTQLSMQFEKPTYVSNTGTTIVLTVVSTVVEVGDWVFFNEWTGTNAFTLNFQTGYVSAGSGPGNITVTIPTATLGAGPYSGGIIQYLTNNWPVDANNLNTTDNIKWYDGNPTLGTGKGWVNFCPPISQSNFSINELTAAQYYLVGARMLIAFKDRLVAIGPVVMTSSAGSQVYLEDTVLFSQNGTAYYTASFPASSVNSVVQSTTVFTQQLTPNFISNNSGTETATPNSWFEDQTGFGGFISAGLQDTITTAYPNEDVIILGFTRRQARMVYTGIDALPFNIFIINSELGSIATFSGIIFDRGIMTMGNHGFTLAAQISAQRPDLDIPDQMFEVNLINNGAERITAQRDFINEWAYFTYSPDGVTYNFPGQTLQYNYREGTWAIFNETYTTYGQFRFASGQTWVDIGRMYPTWNDWNDPWSTGADNLLQPKVVGGNAEGFVMVRGVGTGEGTSLFIFSITGNTITSPNHCLNEGDYIVIMGATGAIGSQINGNVFSVLSTTTNTFNLSPAISSTGSDYNGGGLIQRCYVPFVQTREFPVAWNYGRKTRMGAQKYLLTKTNSSQISLLIFLSQNAVGTPDAAFNLGNIVPGVNVTNSGLVYSTVLYTCAESTNLGLTPANTNLQQIIEISSPTTASSPSEALWHRVNTSLIGDTVQIGFWMNDTQMRDPNRINQFAEIEIHAFILDISPSSMLS